MRIEPWLRFITGLIVAATAVSGTRAAEASKTPPLLFEFALYFSPKPSTDPDKELARLLSEPARRLVSFDAVNPATAVATVEPHWVPLAKYAPPTADTLRYVGEGIPPRDAPQLAAADRVLILIFSVSPQQVLLANRAACGLLADLAQATDGRIWDEETRQLFSLERWRAKRIETWQGNLPDMTAQVTMHAYANPDLIRIITLGMRKFGLPDLVVAEIPSQQTRPVGNFINALMQRLVEGQRPEKSRLKLTLSEIRHEAVRTRSLENPAKGAKGTALVSIRAVEREEGDPDNTLWLLDFPESKLKTATERALWGGTELFGSIDKISNTTAGDPEMAAARARAREKFFAQEARFRGDLAFNEHLLVKAPFHEGEHTEYMWVEVVKWGDKKIEGTLSSDPFYVKKFSAGSRVTVPFDDIYDYLLYKPDGTSEGNESGKVLESREKK